MATDTAEDKKIELLNCISALEAATASIAAGIDEQLVTGDQVYNLLWVITQRIKDKAI